MRGRPTTGQCGLLLIAALVAHCAYAAKLYRWTDRDGVVHYGDRAPAGTPARNMKVLPYVLPPDPTARLRIERDGDSGGYQVWAENALAGPIEVMLDFVKRENTQGDPPLPARATVPARGTALVANLFAQQPGRAGSFELRLESIPGDPSARPRDVVYRPPLAAPRVGQGYGGRFSHTDVQNRYAVDFAADIGTPVLAAREGVIMQVASDYARAGLNRERFGGRANFVRILHDDGSMALYAHLKPEGALVRVGQRVSAGQRIGLSGNTGFTTGPHLHFALQVNRGMRLISIPFRMPGVTPVTAR